MDNQQSHLQTAELRKLRHSLAIRGFEPSRPSNESSWAAAEVLSQRVPGYVTRWTGCWMCRLVPGT